MRYLKITPPVATTVHKTLLVSVTVVDGAKYYRPIGLLDRAHQTLRSRYTDVHRPITRTFSVHSRQKALDCISASCAAGRLPRISVFSSSSFASFFRFSLVFLTQVGTEVGDRSCVYHLVI